MKQSGILIFVEQLLASTVSAQRLDELFALIVQGAAHGCDAQMASISLLSEQGDCLEVAHVYGAPGRFLPTRLPLDNTLNGAVLRTARTMWWSDVGRSRIVQHAESARNFKVRGLVISPLRKGDVALGTLAVAKNGPWPRTVAMERFIRLLAHAASLVIQLHRLRRTDPVGPSPNCRLTVREGDIAKLLVGGKAYKEISRALGISERTIGHRVEHMKLRFGHSTVHGLVAHLVRQGFYTSRMQTHPETRAHGWASSL